VELSHYCTFAGDSLCAPSTNAAQLKLLRPSFEIVSNVLLWAASDDQNHQIVEIIISHIDGFFKSQISAYWFRQSWCTSDAVLNLFAEQDNQLISILMRVQQLWQCRNYLSAKGLQLPEPWHPHRMFICFLKHIGFDHLVLIDFLISNETNFVEYLLQYLRFVIQGQKHADCDDAGFKQHCPAVDPEGKIQLQSCLSDLASTIERMTHKGLFPYNAAPLVSRLRQFLELL